VIAAKIRNCLEQEYPLDRLEILIGCDACADRTAAAAVAMGSPNLRVIEYSERSGKPGTLNQLVPEAHGDVVVFSDANTLFAPGALRSLMRHFAQPQVGCVAGDLRLRPAGGSETEGIYWRYESFLKFLESRLNMMVGAHGGMFATRRSLYEPLPEGTIVDDFLTAMRIRERGYRVVYDPEAVGYEETNSIGQEFRRRVRIGAGNLHALRYTWRLLSPGAGLVAFSYWSHKVLRWLVPFALLLAFGCSVALARETPYAVFAVLSVWFVLMGWIGYRLERNRVRIRMLSVPCYFLSLNLALLCGFILYVCGRERGVWRPTAREAGQATEVLPDSETISHRR
jgi:cellulose synthase/poly-beta-1,6-N-acetylglucosamine synthase-like glycosyltransferase